MSEQDHYAVLQIKSTATATEIKSSYRKLALLWHPDRNKGDEEEAKRKFQVIQAAYDVLNDPVKRRDYDNKRKLSAARAAASNTPRRYETSTPKPTATSAYRSTRAEATPGGAANSFKFYADNVHKSGKHSHAYPGTSAPSDSSTRAQAGGSRSETPHRASEKNKPKMGSSRHNNLWDDLPRDFARSSRRSPPPRANGTASAGPGAYAAHKQRTTSSSRPTTPPGTYTATGRVWTAEREKTGSYSYTPQGKERFTTLRPGSPLDIAKEREKMQKEREREERQKEREKEREREARERERERRESARRASRKERASDESGPEMYDIPRSSSKHRSSYRRRVPIVEDDDSDEESDPAYRTFQERIAKERSRTRRDSNPLFPPGFSTPRRDSRATSPNMAKSAPKPTKIHIHTADPKAPFSYVPHMDPPTFEDLAGNRFSYDKMDLPKDPGLGNVNWAKNPSGINFSSGTTDPHSPTHPPSFPHLHTHPPPPPFPFPPPPPPHGHSHHHGHSRSYSHPINLPDPFMFPFPFPPPPRISTPPPGWAAFLHEQIQINAHPGSIPVFGSPTTPNAPGTTPTGDAKKTFDQSEWEKNFDSTNVFAFQVHDSSPRKVPSKSSEPNLRNAKRNPTRATSIPKFEDLNINLNLNLNGGNPTIRPTTTPPLNTTAPPPTAFGANLSTPNEKGPTKKGSRTSLNAMDIDTPSPKGTIPSSAPKQSSGFGLGNMSMPPPPAPKMNGTPSKTTPTMNPTSTFTSAAPHMPSFPIPSLSTKIPIEIPNTITVEPPGLSTPGPSVTSTTTSGGPSLADLGSVPPFAAAAFGIADMSAMRDNLPFQSRASSIPPSVTSTTTQPPTAPPSAVAGDSDSDSESPPFTIPKAPKLPELPSEILTLPEYNQLYSTMSAHIKAWSIYEFKMLEAISSRTSLPSSSTGPSSLSGFGGLGGADAPLRDEKQMRRLVRRLEELRKLREAWERAQRGFERNLEGFRSRREGFRRLQREGEKLVGMGL